MLEKFIEFCKIATVSIGITFIVIVAIIALLVGIEIASKKEDEDCDFWEED